MSSTQPTPEPQDGSGQSHSPRDDSQSAGVPTPGGMGFFRALFDFSFRHFVTPAVIQVYYAVALVVLAIGVIAGLISAIVLATESPGLGIVQLFLVPIFGFVYLLVLRMVLELVANLFRIGADVKAMREHAERS